MNRPEPASPAPRSRRSSVRAALAAALCVAALAAAPAARAERADRDKPTNVEADAMQYDDLKQVNVFTGHVTLTKGTLVIHADRLVVRQDPEGYQYATAYGKPATFRQKRDGVDQFVQGAADELDYDGKTEELRLQRRASLKRLEGDRVADEVHGNLIVYNSLTDFFRVESGGPASATPENPSGRVRVIIQPKAVSPEPPARVRLTPAPTLEEPGK